jgi:hypothetical protein
MFSPCQLSYMHRLHITGQHSVGGIYLLSQLQGLLTFRNQLHGYSKRELPGSRYSQKGSSSEHQFGLSIENSGTMLYSSKGERDVYYQWKDDLAILMNICRVSKFTASTKEEIPIGVEINHLKEQFAYQPTAFSRTYVEAKFENNA